MLGAIIAIGDTRPVTPERVERVRRALAQHAEPVVTFGGVGEGGAHQVPLPPSVGELGAVAFVLARAGDDHAIVAAADLRHPSSELLRYMIHVRGSFDAVVPEAMDGAVQPLCALYHARCARRAQGLVTTGERDLLRLIEGLHVRRVSGEEVAKFGRPGELLARGE